MENYGCINNASGVITMPDGTKRTPYARILVRPTAKEISLRYARHAVAERYSDCKDEAMLELVANEISDDFLAGMKFGLENPSYAPPTPENSDVQEDVRHDDNTEADGNHPQLF